MGKLRWMHFYVVKFKYSISVFATRNGSLHLHNVFLPTHKHFGPLIKPHYLIYDKTHQ